MNRIMSQIVQSVIVAMVLILTQVTPAVGMDIMILGDSITQADNTHLSFRYNLWTKLIDDGRSFNLVGSLDNNHNGNPYWPPHMEQNFDQDHEGHWGWRADEILNGRQGDGSLSEWLVSYTPDIALIHIGTNDVDQLQSTESSVTEIKEIIDTLRTDNPNMIIFLAKLIPINSVLYNPGIIELNAEIDGIAADKSTVDSPVWVVDQYNGFDAAAYRL